MAIDVAFVFLKIVVGREARNRKGVPQVRSETKGTEYRWPLHLASSTVKR